MKSIQFSYDAEGDILEISFAPEQPSRCTGVELNDNIVVFANHELTETNGLTLLSYSKLLLLPHINLDALSFLPEDKLKKLFILFRASPLSNFIEIVDETQKSCRILNPNLHELAEMSNLT